MGLSCRHRAGGLFALGIGVVCASCASGAPNDAARTNDRTRTADAATAVEILATSPVSGWLTTIAVDATHVYWSAPTGVMKVLKTGGAPELVAPTTTSASAIAVDATSLFYAADGKIREVPFDGRESTLPVPSAVTNAIAVDATFIYWAHSSGAIMRLRRDGGQPEQISGSFAYATRLAVDAGAVYWVDSTGVLTPTPGGPFGTYLWERGLSSILSLIAARGSEVFVTDKGAAGGAVFSVPVTGGEPRTLATPQFPVGLAVDATNVYFADRERGTVEFVPRSMGAAVPLAATQMGPDAIALDENFVYWVNTSGSIARARKP